MARIRWMKSHISWLSLLVQQEHINGRAQWLQVPNWLFEDVVICLQEFGMWSSVSLCVIMCVEDPYFLFFVDLLCR